MERLSRKSVASMAILAVAALAIAALMEARSSVETPEHGAQVLPQGAYCVLPATDEFQLPHSFVHIGDTDPMKDLIRVQMAHFLTFLEVESRLRLCPIFCPRTMPNPNLQPISEYTTVFKNLSTQTGQRRYKLAEGLVNVQLTTAGESLDDDTVLLTVLRQCKPSCLAVQWKETITVKDVKQRMVRIQFIEFRKLHSLDCVRADASTRSKPLIGCLVAVKKMIRVKQVTPMDFEDGVVKVDLNDANAELLQLSGGLSYTAVQDTMRNVRRAGREPDGDFPTIHRIVQEQLKPVLDEDGVKFNEDRTMAALNEHDLRIISYHPVDDPSAGDVTNPTSWYYMIIELPGAQQDMKDYGHVCLAYDAKVKFMLDGLLVMPLCTTRPVLPNLPGLKTPAYGLPYQHITQVSVTGTV